MNTIGFYLVQLSVEEEKNMRAIDIEFKLPKPSYTIDTLTYLSEKYPDHSFSVIMGSDSFQNISRWKNYEQILKNYQIYIYPRSGSSEIEKYPNARVNVVKAPISGNFGYTST